MNKLIKIVLILAAIICLMVFVALINSPFHFKGLDTEYEYVNVKRVDGMLLTIAFVSLLRETFYDCCY